MSKSSSSHFKSNQAQVKTSKKLSSALRHQAENMKLSISADGYVDVQELLRHSQFRGVTFQQVEECVLKCQKQRFQLKTNSVGVVFIRATQVGVDIYAHPLHYSINNHIYRYIYNYAYTCTIYIYNLYLHLIYSTDSCVSTSLELCFLIIMIINNNNHN